MKRLFVFSAVLSVSFAASAVIENVVTSGCTPGVWTEDLVAARTYAKNNGTFVCIEWGKNNGDCGNCNSTAKNIFNKEEFKEWSRKNRIPIVCADYSKSSSASSFVWSKYYNNKAASFPGFIVMDPHNNDKQILRAYYALAARQTGSGTAPATEVCPRAFYVSPMNPDKTIRFVDWCLSIYNDTPSAARAITVDAEKAASPTVNKLWGTVYGENNLSATNHWQINSAGVRISLQSYCDNQADWYKFTAKSGQAYKVTTPLLYDEKGHGVVCFFENLDSATAGSASYEAATNNAIAMAKMSECKNGWKFVSPVNGTAYLLFTRPEVEDVVYLSDKGVEYTGKSQFDLKYTFTLSETTNESYWFDVANCETTEGGPVFDVSVYRSTSGSAATLGLVYDGEGYDAAVSATNVTFQANSKSAVFRVKPKAADAIWSPDRAFSITIDTDRTPEEGYTTLRIKVADSIPMDSNNGADNTPAGAQTLAAGDTAEWLNGTDIVDYFKLEASSNIVYSLDLSVTAASAGLGGVSLAVDGHDALTATMDAPTGIVFGVFTNSTVFVKVERARDDLASANYKIGLSESGKPVVKMSDSRVECPLSLTNATAQLTIESDSLAKDKVVFWRTAVVGNDNAEADKDFTPVAAGEVTLDGTIDVSLVGRTEFRGTRSFTVQLLPDPDSLYLVGSPSEASVVVNSEPQGNSDGATAAEAHATAVSQETGVRNASGSVNVDWIAVNGVSNGLYRISAGDLLLLPESAAVTVTVFTNTSSAAYGSWSLCDLANASVAELTCPTLAFEGLTNDTVWISVSREPDAAVRCEYNLQVCKWTRPVIGFGTKPEPVNPPEVVSVTTNEHGYGTIVLRNYADCAAQSIDDTNSVYSVALVRTGNTNYTDRVFVSCQLPDRVGMSLENEEVVFAPGVASTNVDIVLYRDYNTAVWTTNQTFEIVFKLKNPDACEKETFGWKTEIATASGSTNETDVVAFNDVLKLTLVDTNTEYENGDSAAESSSNPVVADVDLSPAVSEFQRTLNGADTADWFSFNVRSGTTYRVSLDKVEMLGVNETSVSLVAAFGNLSVTNTIDRLKAPDFADFDVNADGKMTVCVVRGGSNALENVSVSYVLQVREWPWPMVSLDKAAMTITNAVDSVEVLLWRTNNTENVDTVRVKVNGVEKERVQFAVGDTNKTVRVDVARNETECWRTNSTISVSVEKVDEADKLKLVEPSSLSITICDKNDEFDSNDPGDDEVAGAVGRAVGERWEGARLNGADSSDWFSLTNLVVGRGYGVVVSVDSNATASADGLSAVFYANGSSFASVPLVGGSSETNFIATASAVEVNIVRKPGSGASVKYGVDSWEWPEFSLGTDYIAISNNVSSADIAIWRTNNMDFASSVEVLTNNAFWCTVAFAEGEPSKTVVLAGLPTNGTSFWLGDYSIDVSLRVPAGGQATLGAPCDAEIKVYDKNGELDEYDRSDDSRDGATEFAMSKALSTHDASRLNGSDVSDWYRFTGIHSNKFYRFVLSLDDDATSAGAAATAWFYINGSSEPAGSVQVASAATNLAFRVETDDDIFVNIVRAEDTSVSMAYSISYREQAPSWASFAVDSVTVSEAAAAVYVDVACTTDGGAQLDVDAVVSVTPTVCDGVDWPASAPEDFDPTPITVTWAAGTTGGVRRVAVPLTNYDSVWEGDEVFKLVLSSISDTELGDIPEVQVTIAERDAPVYGTVGVTSVNGSAPSKTVTIAAAEGSTVPVEVTRVGGKAGAIAGLWTWTVGKSKTVVTNESLFADREIGAKTVEVPVPVTPGFQQAQAATLAFSLLQKTVKVTAGTVTSFKFELSDSSYSGEAADWNGGDLAKPSWTSLPGAWYLSTDGALCSATPAAGKSTVLSTVLTGPGVLTLVAEIANGCTLAATVGGVKTALANGTNTIAVAAGQRTVSVVFTRPAKGASDSASARITYVKYERDPSANAVGTYSGLVLSTMDGTVPGYATLTVATGGRMSGKLKFANLTWTFTATGGWGANWTKSVLAKSGKTAMEVVLSLDLDNGMVEVTGQNVAGTLARNCMSDKPLSSAAAAAMSMAEGYHTISVYNCCDMEDYGSGYLTMTVARTGVARLTGVLGDGQSVSLSGALSVDAGGVPYVCLFSAPASYRGGWLVQRLTFADADGGGASVEGVADATLEALALDGRGSWEKDATLDSFVRNPHFGGGYYDKTSNLYDYYSSLSLGKVQGYGALLVGGTTTNAIAWAGDEKHEVSFSFNANGSGVVATTAGGDGSLMSMSFTRATGVFSGAIRGVYEYLWNGRTRSVTKSTAYRGVFTPIRPDMSDGVVGRGYFLLPYTGDDGLARKQSCNIVIKE